MEEWEEGKGCIEFEYSVFWRLPFLLLLIYNVVKYMEWTRLNTEDWRIQQTLFTSKYLPSEKQQLR